MIFALDIAINTGFAFGEPGSRPTIGSVRFASEGASHEAVFAAALSWATKQLREHKPTTVVWEAPIPTSFKFSGGTNVNTSTLLFGLPAIIGATAFLLGIFDIRKARTSDIRNHFIGENPKGPDGKRLTMRRCRQLGWPVDDNNQADAAATWSYMASLIDPVQAIKQTPLFRVV